jgi:hypothetical protein
MTRLQSLKHRREILILANQKNHYTQIGNSKIEKYYRVLLPIKKQINEIECVNVRPLKAIVGIRVKDLMELNQVQKNKSIITNAENR